MELTIVLMALIVYGGLEVKNRIELSQSVAREVTTAKAALHLIERKKKEAETLRRQALEQFDARQMARAESTWTRPGAIRRPGGERLGGGLEMFGIGLALVPILAIIAGILILVMPKYFRLVVAIFLIVWGILELL